ncbi:MAG: SCO family protein [Nitrosomonas sp.]|nr:SCO family protein [Nitrosomonas sp.]
MKSYLFSAVIVFSMLVMNIAFADSGNTNHPEYGRSIHEYRTPNVQLIDAQENEIDFADAVANEEMVIISFAFTSCTGTCPVITANLVRAIPELQKTEGSYRIFLISLDPEHDTPARLRTYEQRFGIEDNITLLTGNRNAIHDLLRAYNAVYPGGNRMNHQPLTLVRAGSDAPWIRLEGLVSGSNLAHEVRIAIEQANQTS